jgi:hypothetical protein
MTVLLENAKRGHTLWSSPQALHSLGLQEENVTPHPERVRLSHLQFWSTPQFALLDRRYLDQLKAF